MDTVKFLRMLADLIDAAQGSLSKGSISDEKTIQSDETDVMVPPLQQEIELMKKATNVDSVFDKTKEVEEPEESEVIEVGDTNNDTNNELSILKRNAGLGLGLTDD